MNKTQYINVIRNIYDIFTNFDIKGNYVFTGSGVLNLYKLLNREISDVDLILCNSDQASIDKIKDLYKLFGTKSNKYQEENHYPLNITLQDGSTVHLDIFIEPKTDAYSINKVVGEKFYFATVQHIMKAKLKYNRPKDRKDWLDVQLNLLDKLSY